MRFISLVLFVSFLVFLLGCDDTRVSNDAVDNFSLADYKSFAIAPISDEASEAYPIYLSDLNERRMRKAVQSVLEGRQLYRVMDETEADLVVALHLKVDTKTYAVHNNVGGHYYRHGYYGAPITYSTGVTTTDYRQYEVGTLIIDLVDAKESKLVWQGIATKTIDTGADPDIEISTVIGKIFEQIPVTTAVP